MKLSERMRKEPQKPYCDDDYLEGLLYKWADEVAQLEEDAGVLAVGDGLRVGVNFVENLMAENEQLVWGIKHSKAYWHFKEVCKEKGWDIDALLKGEDDG